MLSAVANWDAAFARATVEPRYLVTLTVDAGSFKAINGPVSLTADTAAYPASVSRVSQFSARLNIIKRMATLGEMTVSFAADGWARKIIVNNRIRGKQLSVSLGAYSLAEADYRSVFVGVISDFTVHADGSVDVKALSGMGVLKDTLITGYWQNMHPLQVISDILTKASVPSALINSTSLDPASHTTISHYVVNRGPICGWVGFDPSVIDPTSAFDLISGVAQTIDGLFVDGEDGQLHFILYDSAASASDAWTDDDILTIEQQPIGVNIINDVAIRFGGMVSRDGPRFSHRLTDSASVTAFQYPSSSSQTYSDDISTDWIDAYAHFERDLDDGTVDKAGVTFAISDTTLLGFTGTRWSGPGFPSGSQPADAVVNSSRTAFLKIEAEIIEVDQVTPDTNHGGLSTRFYNSATGTFTTIGPYPGRATVRIKTRGALGTTAVAHSRTSQLVTDGIVSGQVVDFTLPVAMARARINRFSNDAPVIKVRTNFSKYRLQLGDVVTLTTARYAAYGDDGLTTATKWEITGKEIDVYGGPPSITWELTWSTKSAVPAVTEVHKPTFSFTGKLQAAIHTAVTSGEVTQGVIVTGLTTSISSGLVVTIAAGIAAQGIYRMTLVSDATATMIASNTNWIYVDLINGAFGIRIGSSAPTLLASQIMLSKVVAGVASITSVTNYTATGVLKTGLVSMDALPSRFEQTTNMTPNGNFAHWSKG